MRRAFKILNYMIIPLLLFAFSCAPAKKNPYYAKKRKNSSQVVSSQLGRNRYYFSKDYQKKLTKSVVKRKVKY
jgi:hypothetical protein